MTEKHKILAVLSEEEKDTFLPDDLWEKLVKLPDFEWIKTPVDSSEWKKKLLALQPEIIISCWSTPALPLDLKDKLKLRYVCNLSGTVRKKIPLEYVESGLIVTNWGSSISRTVAECALLLILMALRAATHWTIQMHIEKKWKNPPPYTRSLFERKVGLHGLGAIGRALVPLLQPFNVEISAYSPSVPDSTFKDMGVERVDSLEALFKNSDVLVELAPAKPENHHLVDEKLLRMLPENAVFVNVGRGMVVDERALEKIAGEGKIQLGLDVYEEEPLPENSPLRGLRNVTLFPHLGGPTRDRRRDAGSVSVENIMKYLSGKPLDFVIDSEVYKRST